MVPNTTRDHAPKSWWSTRCVSTGLAMASAMSGRLPVTDRALVIGYTRVSTDEQSLGPVAQRKALERWCATHSARLVGVREDLGVSGGAALDRRPGLLAAIDDVRFHRAGVLLVAKRDRLARDVVIASTIERLVEREGSCVRSADGTGDGDAPEHQLMRSIVDVFAGYERSLIRARTRAALAVKKQRGERVGGIPYGYKLGADGVHLVEDASEQAVIAEIVAFREAGYSVRAIAGRLNALDRPARGSRWHPTSVGRLLNRTARPPVA